VVVGADGIEPPTFAL